jgi:hypothetical protein
MDTTFYGTTIEADVYFSARLHETVWSNTVAADKPKALLAATQIINGLNFKGYKATVYALLLANSAATVAEIRAAEVAQPLEFPRGSDTVVPESIRRATYELAYSLLDGRDPESELEALGITSQKYANVATTYSRDQVPLEHLINGVPSATAWRLIRPFLRDDDAIKLSRVS